MCTYHFLKKKRKEYNCGNDIVENVRKKRKKEEQNCGNDIAKIGEKNAIATILFLFFFLKK